MKPLLEKVTPPDGASWAWLDRRLDDAIPFQWHHHPEFELTLTLNSVGQRFIGDHIGEYGDGDLVLIGPNLPHTWASRAKRDVALPTCGAGDVVPSRLGGRADHIAGRTP
jgi:mannose-6-phosphate isomerase-like protein (cupin superfamily)